MTHPDILKMEKFGEMYLPEVHMLGRCAVCGQAADVHHVTGSKIGMGGDREKVHHLGREAIALCRIHHTEAHVRERDFFERNHIYGIKLDARLCKKLELKE